MNRSNSRYAYGQGVIVRLAVTLGVVFALAMAFTYLSRVSAQARTEMPPSALSAAAPNRSNVPAAPALALRIALEGTTGIEVVRHDRHRHARL